VGVFYFCIMIDYIIVGSGLAGIAFAETALKNNKTIRVFENHSQNSSTVAGGLYNPVILKRFSKLQQAQEQLEELKDFYAAIEDKLNSKFNFPLPVLRKFFSVEEQNNWFAASDKPGLSPFLSTNLISKKYNGIESPFGFGQVLQTGYVDTLFQLKQYRNYLKQQNWIIEESFDYDLLLSDENGVQYESIKAKHIVFCEGFGLHANPYFKHLPLDGTKGELLLVKAPNLDLDSIINASVFILPLGNDLFKIGATYNWDDKTDRVTEEGKAELIEKIKEILNCDFEIVEHLAGVRPTVKDRRPLLGTHPDYRNIHILNGLGTRGVMLGPFMAKILFDHIEHGKPIDRENNITRFDKKK